MKKKPFCSRAERRGFFAGFAVLLTAAIVTLAGCGDVGDPASPPGGDPPGSGFVDVMNITDVPATGTVGTAVDVSGATVVPAAATNKTIVWSVKTPGAGVTTITESSFTPTSTGTVVLTATITSGLTSSTAYTKDFTITIFHAVGDIGPGGGKIFYVSHRGFTSNGSTCHYLEAAPADIGGTFTWASAAHEDTFIGTTKGIGAGAANTITILAKDADAPAAKACADYSSNGYDDWFLPNIEELIAMYQNKDAIGGFSDASYWSSLHNRSSDALLLRFSDGIQLAAGKMHSGGHVRAVRAF